MYIPQVEEGNVLNDSLKLLVKREEEKTEEIDITGNDKSVVATRLVIIVIVLSWYIYGKYALLSLIGLKRHKNFNFLFSFTAALFAFVNNTNDIIHYVYHPTNCHPFYSIFVGSATLNWAPISWLQAYRLIVISKIYLRKKSCIAVSVISICLSCIYCSFYFCNLSIFDYEDSKIMGCAVTNPGTYTYYVMFSDIADSVFAFGALTFLIFRSVRNLKELNTRNERLNDLVGQGVLELLIIAFAKIIIYPMIALTSYIPAFDIFWDILSIVVIICAYNLVNFPYEHCDEYRYSFRRGVFGLLESSVNHSQNGTSSRYSVSGSNSQTNYTPKLTKTEPAAPTSIKKEIINDQV